MRGLTFGKERIWFIGKKSSYKKIDVDMKKLEIKRRKGWLFFEEVDNGGLDGVGFEVVEAAFGDGEREGRVAFEAGGVGGS